MSQAGLFLGLNPDSYIVLVTVLLSAVVMAVMDHLMSIRVVEQRAQRAARNGGGGGIPPPPSPTSGPSPAKPSGPNSTLDLHGILNGKSSTKEEEYARQRGGPVRSLRSKRTVKKVRMV